MRNGVPPLAEVAGPHWAAAAEGTLALPKCEACDHLFFPPARLCPRCLSEAIDWTPVEGRGVIEGWCAFHRPYYPDFWLGLPYNVVLVRLDAGPHLFSNLVGVDRPAVGMRVAPVFTPVADGQAVVQFERDGG